MTKEFHKMYNQTLKLALNLPKKTPHEYVNKLAGTWNMKTLIDISYVTNVEKWYKMYGRNSKFNGITHKINERLEEIRNELRIPREIPLSKETILIAYGEQEEEKPWHWKNRIKK